jgi:hypothetical protein
VRKAVLSQLFQSRDRLQIYGHQAQETDDYRLATKFSGIITINAGLVAHLYAM